MMVVQLSTHQQKDCTMRIVTLFLVAALLAGCNVVIIPVPIDGLTVPDRLPTPEPAAAAAAPADGSLVDLSGIPYTVQAHNTVSVVQVRSKGAILGGTLMLDGELRNDGSEPVPYNIITLRVYDAAGALLDVGSGGAMEIAPGETIAFMASADVPYSDVSRYVIEIR
jgi:hypothetical protein